MRRMSKAPLLIASSCILSLALVAAPAPTAAVAADRETPKTWSSLKVKHGEKRTNFYLTTGKPGRIVVKVNGQTKTIKSTGLDRKVRIGVPRGWTPNCRTSTVALKMVGHHWKKRTWRRAQVTDRTGCRPALTQEQKALRVAKAQVGKPYRWGQAGPHGFDCSGLINYSYRKATGRTLPRSSTALKNAAQRIPRSAARPGDLVWTPGHIAFYAGRGRVVEAATPRTGVVYRTMWQSNPVFLRI